MKRYALIVAACTIAISAAAQELTKEITVEKDYVPVERKATKQNALPIVHKNTLKMNTKLDYSDWTMPATIPASIPTMLPYGYQTEKKFSSYKGYAGLGIGSHLNILANAGYRAIETEKSSLNLWINHNSTWAGKNTANTQEEKLKQKFNDNTIGANFAHDFYQGTLNVDAKFNFDIFNYYGANDATQNVSNSPFSDFGNQTFTQFNVNAGWTSNLPEEKFSYSAEAGFGLGGFSKGVFPDYKGLKETSFFVALNGEYNLNEEMNIGAKINTDFANYSSSPCLDFNTWKIAPEKHNTLGIVHLSPYLLLEREKLLLRLGFNAEIGIHAGSGFEISPNVKLDYKLSRGIGVFIDLNGGKQINNLWKMKLANRYIHPSFRPNSSHTPVDIEAGVNIGGFAGFKAKIFGGFANYKDIRTPMLINGPIVSSATYDIDHSHMTKATIYQPIDLSGWKAGVELSYKYRSLIDANARFTYSPQDNDSGCFLGIDRAEYVADAKVRITPIEKLGVTVGYQMRGNRAMYGKQTHNDGTEYWEHVNLNNVMDLNLGVSYKIIDNATIYIQGNNLMNKQWDALHLQGAQGINILGGVNFVF